MQYSEVPSDAPVGTATLLKTQQLLPDDLEQLRSAEPLASAGASPVGAPEPEIVQDDEGVIQQYMERLLKRVASQGREPEVTSVAPQAKSPPPPVKQPPTPPPATGSELAVRLEPVAGADVAGRDMQGAALPGDDGADDRDGSTQPTTRSRSVGAESLQAMRELANQSARSAIKRFDVRRYATIAIGELCVATICFTASTAIIRMSHAATRSTQIGGMIGMVFSAMMFLRACRKLLNIRRLKKSAQAELQAELQARAVEPADEARPTAEQNDRLGSVLDAAQSELGEMRCLAAASDELFPAAADLDGVTSELTTAGDSNDEDVVEATCCGEGEWNEPAAEEDTDRDSRGSGL